MNDQIDSSSLAPWLNGESFEQVCSRYDRDGYVIFENVMQPDQVASVRAALKPHLTKTGRNDFEGFHSNRVYSLIAKSPEVFSDMVTHPLALAFAERDLGRSCLLSALLAINLLPGESVQGWHCDDEQVAVPRPHQPFGVSTFWAIDDTTATNGATEIIPGSHQWGQTEIATLPADGGLYGTKAKQVDEDLQPRTDSIKATMQAGSLMIAKGTLYHRGGANLSDTSRLIVTPQYCPGWARQLENMILSVSPKVAATLPKRTRELLGYNIHAAFMGYVDGVHPDRTLGIEA
ncbi:MAG: phytanoyl-CoA dioxygenase family protein [Halioglobus sp.]